jgi:hypothetical protein
MRGRVLDEAFEKVVSDVGHVVFRISTESSPPSADVLALWPLLNRDKMKKWTGCHFVIGRRSCRCSISIRCCRLCRITNG